MRSLKTWYLCLMQCSCNALLPSPAMFLLAKVDKNHLVLVTDRIPRRPDPRGYRRFPWLVDWCASGPIVCDGGRGFGR